MQAQVGDKEVVCYFEFKISSDHDNQNKQNNRVVTITNKPRKYMSVNSICHMLQWSSGRKPDCSA